MNHVIINASGLLPLMYHPLYFIFSDFINNLDTEFLDLHFERLLNELEDELDVKTVFDICTKIHYYITTLVLSKVPNVLNYKVTKVEQDERRGYYLLKIEYTEL